jgi:hypothetical protein
MLSSMELLSFHFRGIDFSAGARRSMRGVVELSTPSAQRSGQERWRTSLVGSPILRLAATKQDLPGLVSRWDPVVPAFPRNKSFETDQ